MAEAGLVVPSPPQLLSAKRHGALGWHGPSDTEAVTALSSVPIGAREAAAVATSLPIGIFGSDVRGLHLRAILGDSGRAVWSLSELRYTPFALRFYPFSALRTQDSETDKLQWRLALHEDADCVHPKGHPLFDDAGKPKEATLKITKLFEAACADYSLGHLMCVHLMKTSVLSKAKAPAPACLTVNSQALHQLSGAALESLHRNGALRLAHSIETSNLHLSRLKRAETPATPADPPPQSSPEAQSDFLDAVISDISVEPAFQTES